MKIVHTMLVNMSDGGKITLVATVSGHIKVVIEGASLHNDATKQEYMDVISWASSYLENKLKSMEVRR